MPHIQLSEGLAGISAGFAFRPETARPLQELAHVLMHAHNSLSAGDRELIAAYISAQNGCYYCEHSHGATAACHLDGDSTLVGAVIRDYNSAPVSPKLKALLKIAGRVQEDGKHVAVDDVACARMLGATDLEIHDTVLISAAFCMYNRYVDGLATWQPRNSDFYAEMGRYDAKYGYLPVDPDDGSPAASS